MAASVAVWGMLIHVLWSFNPMQLSPMRSRSGENSSALLKAVSQPVLLSSHAHYCMFVCISTTIVPVLLFHRHLVSQCEGRRTEKKL